MENGSQETTAETKTPSLENAKDFSEYEQLRKNGVSVEAEVSAPEVKASSETADESETSEQEVSEGESDEESTPDEGDDEASEEIKPKKKSGTQRRIEKLVKQRAEVERERDFFREQLLKAQSAQKPEAEKPQAKAQAEGRPKSEDYETHEDWVEAVADWRADQKIQALKEQDRQDKLKADESAAGEKLAKEIGTFKQAHPDFDERIESVDHIPLSITVRDAIKKHGPALMYELAGDPGRLERICSMPVLDAAEEIGAIRSQIKKASEKPETKITTKAPAPVVPVSTKGSGSAKKSIFDAKDFAEYEKIRLEQLKNK